MQTESKKVKLLVQFTQKLSEWDPMGLGGKNSFEYEPEALSILARFSETGFHMAETKEVALPLAIGIVAEVMKFWFDSRVQQDQEQMEKWRFIAGALLDTYMQAWEKDKQAAAERVEYVTVG
jgi:hypothetical protein